MAAALFPEKLQKEGNEVSTSDVLAGKKLCLIYFSAHWCPPCRGFTPKLVEWFKNFEENHPEKGKMAVVFASSDRSESDFNEYYAEMHGFHAVPFADRKAKDTLSQKFKVQGIPTLVIVDAQTGNLVTRDGRSIVTNDPKAEGFPFTPKSLGEILKGKYLKQKEEVTEEAFKDKYIGLYFSASWCGPCHRFTPELVKTYNTLVQAGKPFEVVFVSADRDQASFDEYYGKMPWMALPLKDKRADLLNSHFEVQGIPHLVIIAPDGTTVTDDGRSAVGSDPTGEHFPWKPKALRKLNENTISAVNETPALLVLTGDSEEQHKQMFEALSGEAASIEEKAAEMKESLPVVMLVTDPEDDETEKMLRRFAKLGDDTCLAILDIPSQTVYKAEKQDLAVDNVLAFLHDFRAGKLAGEKLSR
eukprot:m.170017 g.170017  ORF g.170017 m.170017 type:complete len:416 (+) comp21212_c0_seq1:174-1421(+)